MTDPRNQNSTPSESIHKIERGDDLAQGRDLAAENRAKLAELFPGLITEAVAEDGSTIPAVDADALRDLVGATVDSEDTTSGASGGRGEKFGLSWHGKAAARRLALTPSTGTLRPCPSDDESVDWDTTKNVVIEGDNLEVLKLLQKSYAGQVKLIYIDPPYNTGKDFVYKDNFRDPLGQYERYTGQRGEEGEALVNKENRDSGGRFHTDWLNMIYPRLLLARELLREDGLLFLSIDDTEITNVRMLLDDIFGEECHVAQLVWKNKYNAGALTKGFSSVHEYILCYSRHDIKNITQPLDDKDISKYKGRDEKYPTRGGFVTQPLMTRSKDPRPNLVYPVVINGKTIHPDKQWIWEKSKLEAAIANNEVVVNETDGKISVRGKQYLRDEFGQIREKKPISIFTGPFNQEGGREFQEMFGEKAFSFPKPMSLIKQIVSMTINDTKGRDDIILDFFAGSGTTGHAVMAQNAADGGDRRYVLVQLPEPISGAGRDDYPTIAELTKERLRRAGRKIREEHEGKLGAATSGGLDTGFRVFKLDTANVKAWEAPTTDALEPGQIETLLQENVDGVKLDRSENDLLWGAMLNLGLPLDGTVNPRKIDTPGGEMTVYVAGAGTLLACFAKSIDRDAGEALAGGLANLIKEAEVEGDVTVLLRDSAFGTGSGGGDDAVKVNLVENLRQHAPDADKVRVLSI